LARMSMATETNLSSERPSIPVVRIALRDGEAAREQEMQLAECREPRPSAVRMKRWCGYGAERV
jgi:hypothetical protein